MTDYEVVDLGNFPVDEATPVVAGPRGQAGADGTDGASAYEVAVANGFVGTEAEWLASLKGADGVGGGGGAVDSVNGQAGVVVLDAADVGADPAGTAAAASTADRARANHTGTQTSATISDFTEAVQDAVAALLASGTNVTLTYDDAANSLTVTAATGGDAEVMRDTIGAALVGVGNVAVTVNDAADTITISTTATVNSTDAALRDRSTHTGTQSMSTISDAGTAATKNTGTASGNVPLLGTGGRLPIAQIASGTPDGTKFVRDDGQLAVPAGGGASSAWTQNVDNPLTSLTGWSVGSGTWTASAAGIRQSATTASQKRLFSSVVDLSLVDVVMEAEFNAAAFPDANSRMGFLIGAQGSGTADSSGAPLVAFAGTGSVSKIYTETDAVAAIVGVNLPSTYALSTWNKLRVHKVGGAFTAWVNGVYFITIDANWGNVGGWRWGLYGYAADFTVRNLKVWTRTAPA